MIPNMVYVIYDNVVIDLIPQEQWDEQDYVYIERAYGRKVDWVCSWYTNKEEVLLSRLGK